MEFVRKMVFSQSLPRISKNVIKKNRVHLNLIKNSKPLLDELLINPSFSLVSLFLKFIQDDYYKYGDLCIFKSYFEEKIHDCLEYLLKAQQLKTNNQLDKLKENQSESKESILNKYLQSYAESITYFLHEKKTTLDAVQFHEQYKNPFLDLIEKDVAKLTIEKNYSNFYFIQEISEHQNTYGIFMYFRFDKIHLVLYNPKIGIKIFNHNEIIFFKEYFNKLIKKYNKNYASFKLKIRCEKNAVQIKNTIDEISFQSIIKKSAIKFINNMNLRKNGQLLDALKEDWLYCHSILKNDKKWSKEIFSEFFAKYAELIQKLKQNFDFLTEKNFWIFFLIEYYSTNTELNKIQLNSLDPFLGKETIFDFLNHFHNKRLVISQIQAKKIICLIIIETYKKISFFNFRIPFFPKITPISLGAVQHNFKQQFSSQY